MKVYSFIDIINLGDKYFQKKHLINFLKYIRTFLRSQFKKWQNNKNQNFNDTIRFHLIQTNYVSQKRSDNILSLKTNLKIFTISRCKNNVIKCISYIHNLN